MTVVLSHTTACSYWRRYTGKAPTRVRIKPELPSSAFCLSEPQECLSAREPDDYGTTLLNAMLSRHGHLDVLVNSATERRRTKPWKCHISPKELPGASYCRLNGEFAIVSPELSFWQMSKKLPFVHLVQYGIELCSTYAISEDDEAGFIQRQSVTSPRQLLSYLDRIPSSAKTKTAREALRWVGSLSASPRETAVFMLLCLPYRHGGYALPLPAMNYQVDLNPPLRRIAGRRSFRCDLYWAESRLDVEYDSTQFHTGEERIESDSIRRNVLGDLDIRVITITRRQLSNIVYFDGVAREIASFIGKKIRTDEAAFCEHRIALRNLLFRERLEC